MVERLLAWASSRGLQALFGTGRIASLQLGIKRPDTYIFPFFVFSNGGVEVEFQTMLSAPYPPFHRLDKREELLARLNSIEGVDLPIERIAKRPNFALSLLQDNGRLEQFIEIFEWTLREAEASGIGIANLEIAKQERDSEASDAR